MKIFEDYQKELENDTKIDQLNLADVQMMLPAIKHKWVARLIKHKIEIKKLNSLLHVARNKIIDRQTNDKKVAISRPALEKEVDKNEVIVKIKKNIEEQQLIVLYLEKVESVFRSMTYDIRNLVEIMKLESL